MTEAANASLRRNLGVAMLALIASSGTLVCCVLPAVMVAVGAGAVLAGLVSNVPQLIWLSLHKGLVFGFAAAMLAVSGGLLWNARRLPCPADSRLALACARLRRSSLIVWGVAVGFTALGALFAFVLPVL